MRSFFSRAINRIKRGATASYGFLTSQSVVILNYHRINALTTEASTITVTPENFREHMRILCENYEPIPLRSIGSRLSLPAFEKRGKIPVVVTFDDGYADTYKNAFPVLKEFGIPGTVFVTTGMIDGEYEFWWDELEELFVEKLPMAKQQEFFSTLPKKLGDEARMYPNTNYSYSVLSVGLKLLGEPYISRALEKLREMTNSSRRVAREPQKAMTTAQLCDLAKSDLIEIGAHTVSHACLGILPRSEQLREIKESKESLEKILSRPVHSIAYPFGSRTDFNRDTLEVSHDLGFEQGLTTIQGVALPQHNRFALPRFFVKNWNSTDFLHQLSKFSKIG